MNIIGQSLYLPFWWLRAKAGRRQPLQSVIFISDRCNLSCRHCSVYNHVNPSVKTFAQIEEELRYCYSLGSRFVDFEGGEPCQKNRFLLLHHHDQRPAAVRRKRG